MRLNGVGEFVALVDVDPDAAGGDMEGADVDRRGKALQEGADPLFRILRVGNGHQQGELVAAKPGDDTVLGRNIVEELADMVEQVVAGRMADRTPNLRAS